MSLVEFISLALDGVIVLSADLKVTALIGAWLLPSLPLAPSHLLGSSPQSLRDCY